MQAQTSPFDLASLTAELRATPFAGQLHWFHSIDSTNTHAMHAGELGAPHGSVYVAEQQTGGRGRGGHTWISPSGSGLYLSVLLRPQLAPGDALWISLAAGLAVHQAIGEVTTLKADLRWPNDLLLGRKKFCGILTEMNAEATRVRHMVVGIGINVLATSLRPELHSIATSLEEETGLCWSRQEILCALLKALHVEVDALVNPATQAEAKQSILARLTTASSWIQGKRVRVEESEGYRGRTAGLNEQGFLLVETAKGIRTVLSGGVREDGVPEDKEEE